MNKAEEKLNEYINKNIEKEKDKFACGSKNYYYDWQELKDDIEHKSIQLKECRDIMYNFEMFLKDMNLMTDYRKWLDNQN